MTLTRSTRNSLFFPSSAPRLPAIALALSAICSARPAVAVNIILNFDSAQNQFTSVDPGAVELQRIMSFVEDFWEDVIEDTHTVTINYWYEDLSVLGLHTAVAQIAGREIEANVRMDTIDNGVERPWWFDPTPSGNSEFNVQQVLWRDLTSTQQDDWYNGFVATSVPATFETGYAGNAPSGGVADNKWDMVTSALHEVGHALGMSSGNNATLAETTDGDYDYFPGFIFGQSLAVETDNVSGDDNQDFGHLENTNAGMAGGQAQLGRRRLPTHTDVFAMAASHLYFDLDVPRREFYGGIDWNVDANWSGNKRPGTADDVYIRDAQGSSVTLTARLSADGVAGSLDVSEGANFETDGFKLDVTGDVTISNINSDVFIQPGGELEADEVFIQDDAEIEMSGGTLDARIIKTKPAGRLQSASGTAVVVVSQLLNNNGILDADGDSVMLFSSIDADFPWDLDGDTDEQDGIVDASDGNISFIGGSLTDPFDGSMIIGAGHVISVFNPWVNSSGTLELNGGADFDSRARLNGLLSGTLSMTGGTISVTGVSHIDAPTIIFGGIFNPAVTLGVGDTLEFNGETTIYGGTFTVGNDSKLVFDGDTTISGGTFNTTSNLSAQGVAFHGDTTYNGGTIASTGIAKQEGNATVAAATTINADIFDMDGTGVVANQSWTLNDALTVNADSIDSGNNILHSEFTINSSTSLVPGKLTINLPGANHWTLDSTSNLIMTGQTNVFSSTLDGSDLDLNGTASVTNNVAWDARVNMSGAVVINANSNLRLLGGSTADPYTMDGGLISGMGKLSTIGDKALFGFGTIATAIDFFDEAELRADNGTLTISGALNDVGVLGTADADGTLNITNAWNTNVTDLVDLRGGSIIGSAITNSSSHTVQGFGTLAPNNLVNDGAIVAKGGTLTVDPNNTLDLDGVGENGEIEAIQGNLTIVDIVSEHFDGLAVAGPNRVLTFQNGWILGTGGELELDGGATLGSFTTVAGSQQNLHGVVSATRTARFDIPTLFKFDVSVSLAGSNSTLVLFQPSTVEAGAVFSGLGLLANAAGNTLTLASGATVNVRLFNSGTLEVGGSHGDAAVLALSQGSTGTIHLELGGTSPGSQHDQLVVTGQLTFGGTLQVTTTGGFVPAAGDFFDLFNWGTASGSFTTLTLPVIGGGLMWNASQLYTAGVLKVGLAGDYNLSGTVDAADYVIWRKTFGQSGVGLAADGNGSGTIDSGDLAVWRSHFGQTAGAGAGSAADLQQGVPEPRSVVLIFAALVCLGWRATCRRQ